MFSVKSTVLAVAVAFVASVQADYFIEPSSVPKWQRNNWCVDQKRTCPVICRELDPRTPLVNECDAEALTYGCLCGNGEKPDVEEYTLTLPYYTCTEYGTQCIKACGSDNICAGNCRQQNPCGAQNPTPPNATSTTAAAPASTSVEGAVFTGDLLGNTPKPGGASTAAVEIGRVYGLAVVLGGLFAGFAML